MRIQSKVLYITLAVVIALLPAAITWLMVTWHTGASFSDFVPWVNDEVSLWHQALTFSQHGFTGGGYYTLYEQPAQAPFTHYYAWGPFFPMLQGIFARLFGWKLYSGIIFNVVVLTAAIAFFIVAARPNLPQLILVGALLGTFWVMLIYIPTNMQESFHAAIALVLAAPFGRLIQAGPALPQPWRWALGITIIFASVIRGTWVLAFFPYFLLLSEPRLRSYLFALMKALVLSAAAFAFYSYISSGLPYRFTDQILDAVTMHSSLDDKIGTALSLLGDRFELNQGVLFSMQRIDWLTIGVMMWAQYLMALLGAAIWLGLRAARAYRARRPFRLGETIPREVVFHLLNLSLMLALLFLLYQVDVRMGIAPLLLSLLVMILARHYRVAVGMIALNLLFAPFFVTSYEVFARGRFFPDRHYIAQVESLVNPYVAFQENAPSGWCNTLLIPMELFSWPVTVIPDGIGVSMYLTIDDLPLPVKSKYLVLSENGYQRVSRQQTLEVLNSGTEVPYYSEKLGLYRNAEAACGSERP